MRKTTAIQERHEAIRIMRASLLQGETAEADDIACFDEWARKSWMNDFMLTQPSPEDADVIVTVAGKVDEQIVLSRLVSSLLSPG